MLDMHQIWGAHQPGGVMCRRRTTVANYPANGKPNPGLVGTASNRDGIGAFVTVTAGADKLSAMLRSGRN
jgi:hypothetical protein